MEVPRNEQIIKNNDNHLHNTNVLSIALPANEEGSPILDPGKTTLVPLWVRGDRIGKHLHRFLFTYQSVVSSLFRLIPVFISIIEPSNIHWL